MAGVSSDPDDLVAFVAWSTSEQSRVMQTVTDAYAAARREVGDRGLGRELLVRSLLEGTPADGTAAAAGIVLSKGYLVVLCRSQHRVETGAVRQNPVERVLETVPGALWRGNFSAGTMAVLLPVADSLSVARQVALDLTARIAEATRQRLHCAEAHADTVDAVPSAFAEAKQVIALVASTPDATSRPYRMEELLVELAVSRQPAVQERLAELLNPLKHGTDLLHTLRVLFDCGLDREKTTKALYIHRRTLTYRLRRIRELTGLDPSTAHGIQLLRAALTATRLPVIR